MTWNCVSGASYFLFFFFFFTFLLFIRRHKFLEILSSRLFLGFSLLYRISTILRFWDFCWKCLKCRITCFCPVKLLGLCHKWKLVFKEMFKESELESRDIDLIVFNCLSNMTIGYMDIGHKIICKWRGVLIVPPYKLIMHMHTYKH